MSAHECIGCGQGGERKPGTPGTWFRYDWMKQDISSGYFVICEPCVDRAVKACFGEHGEAGDDLAKLKLHHAMEVEKIQAVLVRLRVDLERTKWQREEAQREQYRAQELDKELARVTAQRDALTQQIDAEELDRKNWTWALQQLAAGHKVTHPLLSRPGCDGSVVKLGDAPSGPIYEVDSGCRYRTLTTESTWLELEHRAQGSRGWSIVKPESHGLIEHPKR